MKEEDFKRNGRTDIKTVINQDLKHSMVMYRLGPVEQFCVDCDTIITKLEVGEADKDGFSLEPGRCRPCGVAEAM